MADIPLLDGFTELSRAPLSARMTLGSEFTYATRNDIPAIIVHNQLVVVENGVQYIYTGTTGTNNAGDWQEVGGSGGGPGGIQQDAMGNLNYQDGTPVGPSLLVGNGSQSVMGDMVLYNVTNNNDGTYTFSNTRTTSNVRFLPTAFRNGDTIMLTITERSTGNRGTATGTGTVSNIALRTGSGDTGYIESFTFTSADDLSAGIDGNAFEEEVVETTIERPATQFVRSPIVVEHFEQISVFFPGGGIAGSDANNTITYTGGIFGQGNTVSGSGITSTLDNQTNFADLIIQNELYFIGTTRGISPIDTFRATSVDRANNTVVFTFVEQNGTTSIATNFGGLDNLSAFLTANFVHHFTGEFNLQRVVIDPNAIPGPIGGSLSQIESNLEAFGVPVGGLYRVGTQLHIRTA